MPITAMMVIRLREAVFLERTKRQARSHSNRREEEARMGCGPCHGCGRIIEELTLSLRLLQKLQPKSTVEGHPTSRVVFKSRHSPTTAPAAHALDDEFGPTEFASPAVS
jgi:hypothetical protein